MSEKIPANNLIPTVQLWDNEKAYLPTVEKIYRASKSDKYSRYEYTIPEGSWTIDVCVSNQHTSVISFKSSEFRARCFDLNPNDTVRVQNIYVTPSQQHFGFDLLDGKTNETIVEIIFNYDKSYKPALTSASLTEYHSATEEQPVEPKPPSETFREKRKRLQSIDYSKDDEDDKRAGRLKPTEYDDWPKELARRNKVDHSVRDTQPPAEDPAAKKGSWWFGSRTHCDVIHEDQAYDHANEDAYLASMRKLLISV